MEKWLISLWQTRTWVTFLLVPLSFFYWLISQTRRLLYQKNIFPRYSAPIPVIIIGNITVGGTGKTPLTLHLVQSLQKQGFFPGIISRGYKARLTQPQQVRQDSDPSVCGDEPVLMANATHAPIFIHHKRARAIHALCQTYPQCNVLVCDDGLQHYALQRDIEIAVIDTTQPVGNGLLLPAGPLREPPARLRTVDFVVYNGNEPVALPHFTSPILMQLQPSYFYQLSHPTLKQPVDYFVKQSCHAVAGIGNPRRFFATLQKLGLDCPATAFPDHHAFKKADLPASDIILVTEKDAVKLARLKDDRIWVLPVHAITEPELGELVATRLHKLKAEQYG
jgi:tetraacyldisaccharide 4'-kinase